MTTTPAPGVLDRLSAIVGADHVQTAEDERRFYSEDLSYERFEIAQAVVAPGSTAEVAEVVREANAAGLAVVPRGGGMSYTQGYTPSTSASVMVDLRRLDAIVEISEDGMYATVGAGCTWEKLHDALGAVGLRAGYFGPLSGRYATVGGTLSQNSLFFGSGVHGMASDNCLGLEVVLAGGRVVRTGAGARPGTPAFSRYFGPDLTGLFLGDTGALGIKTEATLRLVKMPAATRPASFAVPDMPTQITLMGELAKLGLAAEVFGLDPYFHDVLSAAGLGFLAEHRWSVHCVVDGLDDAIADAALAAVTSVGERLGTSIDPTTPMVFRGNPWGSVQAILLGPAGEVAMPVHAILPFSRAQEACRVMLEFLDEHRATLDRHDIKVSMLTAVSSTDFVLDPNFLWFDELGPLRLELIAPESAAEWGKIPPDAEARAAALGLRRELADRFDRLGSAHIQVGKWYECAGVMGPDERALLAGLKGVVDPDNLMNPGALGLSAEPG